MVLSHSFALAIVISLASDVILYMIACVHFRYVVVLIKLFNRVYKRL